MSAEELWGQEIGTEERSQLFRSVSTQGEGGEIITRLGEIAPELPWLP